MTATIQDELASYLRDEADRVTVYDSLDDIERGVTVLSLVGQSDRRRVLLPVLAAAASIAAFVATATIRPGGPSSEELRPGATIVTTAALAPILSTTIPPTTTPTVTVLINQAALPAGAVLQGVAPSCTTTDGVEFACTFEQYPGMTLPQPEHPMIGQGEVIVDDTSHVSGGCRALSEDGLRWTCYVGRRAVDEGIVGENYLGALAQRVYYSG
jgi:hypothetical protein